ncbi:unannotated protein [freshwater metagenome]|uniref:Unannotated protein n=1 Tax=freshwater metagenome TaxID=449393 RepID=A0A6J7ISJ5_9ZZZZ
MTFVLIAVAAWLVLNTALFGVAVGLDRRGRSRETPATTGAGPAEVLSLGGRRVA